MDALKLSAKHAARSLWHDKTFALTVVLTFAVCIAANAALFAAEILATTDSGLRERLRAWRNLRKEEVLAEELPQ